MNDTSFIKLAKKYYSYNTYFITNLFINNCTKYVEDKFRNTNQLAIIAIQNKLRACCIYKIFVIRAESIGSEFVF